MELGTGGRAAARARCRTQRMELGMGGGRSARARDRTPVEPHCAALHDPYMSDAAGAAAYYDPAGLALFDALACDVSSAELLAFLEGDAQELLLPPATDKSGREALHALVRSHLPTVLSDTRAGLVFLCREPGARRPAGLAPRR